MRAALALAALLTLLPVALHADPVTVTDRNGSHSFAAPPARIVVLDWTLAEAVLDLGHVPVGAPEIALYGEWVVNPHVPEAVTDIGLRTEPDLETLAALQPDVILAVDLDPAQEAQLAQIAPVLVWTHWDAGHDNVAATLAVFRQVAALLREEARAEALLAAQEARITALREEFAARFGPAPPPLTLIRLNDARSVWIYGANSVPQYVATRLGFAPELPQPASRWGVAQHPVEALGGATRGLLLAIQPHMTGAEVLESPVWQALPAVAGRRFAEMRAVWSYGSALSIGRTAEAMAAALRALP